MNPADAGNGLEFRARLLQDSNGYFYAVVANVAGSDVCLVFGRYTNSADAKDAAYLAAQRFGGTMVYLGKGRRS
jgi:hypothetical protein